MSDTTQLIKDKLDIVDFLKQYLEVKPAGKNFKALCPFHKEKTPSFMISPERQSWHCFGACGEGGDIIKFLMKYENLEFYDALKILAEKAGVEIKAFSDRDFRSYNALYSLMEEAKNFFKSNLTTSQVVNDYLKERGLETETIREFELGLAPDGSDVLTRHLLKLGYAVSDIEKAGLALKTERGTYWDRFRSRIMFPIHNHFGKVAAFTGRILPTRPEFIEGPGNPSARASSEPQPNSSGFAPAKYVNSPETPLFQKSKILYGLHKAKNNIRQAGAAVLVEGQMDFLMIWQDGVKNAVATSGTALTPDHLKTLRHLADELVLGFDADEGGQAAAERAIDLAGANDFSVKLVNVNELGEELKDPADAVRRKPGAMKELVKNGKSAMDYYFHKYLSRLPGDSRAKKQNIRIVLSKINGLSSALDRSHWLEKLGRLLKISENVLLEEMSALPLAGSAGSPKIMEVQPRYLSEELSRRDLIAQRLLGILFYKNELVKTKEHLRYFPEKYARIYYDFLNNGQNAVADDARQLMDRVNLRFSFENQNIDEDKLEKETGMLIRELKIECLKERRQRAGELIRKLEESGSGAELQSALKEFDAVSKELQKI